MRFKAKIRNKNKENEGIEFEANNRKDAIAYIRSQGYLILELAEICDGEIQKKGLFYKFNAWLKKEAELQQKELEDRIKHESFRDEQLLQLRQQAMVIAPKQSMKQEQFEQQCEEEHEEVVDVPTTPNTQQQFNPEKAVLCSTCNSIVDKESTKCMQCGAKRIPESEKRMQTGCLIIVLILIIYIFSPIIFSTKSSTNDTSRPVRDATNIDERNREWRRETGNWNMNSPEMSQQVTRDVLNFKSFDDIDNYSKEHPDR